MLWLLSKLKAPPAVCKRVLFSFALLLNKQALISISLSFFFSKATTSHRYQTQPWLLSEEFKWLILKKKRTKKCLTPEQPADGFLLWKQWIWFDRWSRCNSLIINTWIPRLKSRLENIYDSITAESNWANIHIKDGWWYLCLVSRTEFFSWLKISTSIRNELKKREITFIWLSATIELVLLMVMNAERAVYWRDIVLGTP